MGLDPKQFRALSAAALLFTLLSAAPSADAEDLFNRPPDEEWKRLQQEDAKERRLEEVLRANQPVLADGDIRGRNWDAAEAKLNVFLKYRPRDTYALFLMARVWAGREDPTRAREYLAKVGKIDPKYRQNNRYEIEPLEARLRQLESRQAADAKLNDPAAKSAILNDIRERLECAKRGSVPLAAADSMGIRPGTACALANEVLTAPVLVERSERRFERGDQVLAEALTKHLQQATADGNVLDSTIPIRLASMPESDMVFVHILFAKSMAQSTALAFVYAVSTNACAADASNALEASSSFGIALRNKFGKPTVQQKRADLIAELQARQTEREKQLRAEASRGGPVRARQVEATIAQDRLVVGLGAMGIAETHPDDMVLKLGWSLADGTKVEAIRGTELECAPSRPSFTVSVVAPALAKQWAASLQGQRERAQAEERKRVQSAATPKL